jgi:hypothetical protein
VYLDAVVAEQRKNALDAKKAVMNQSQTIVWKGDLCARAILLALVNNHFCLDFCWFVHIVNMLIKVFVKE